MKSTLALTALLVGAAVSTAAVAQPAATESGAKAPAKVYHPGGKHDQRAHEATLRARANGQKLERPAVHPGGKHDAQLHEAAIRAEEKQRAAGN